MAVAVVVSIIFMVFIYRELREKTHPPSINAKSSSSTGVLKGASMFMTIIFATAAIAVVAAVVVVGPVLLLLMMKKAVDSPLARNGGLRLNVFWRSLSYRNGASL
jgi:hypothetical protein